MLTPVIQAASSNFAEMAASDPHQASWSGPVPLPRPTSSQISGCSGCDCHHEVNAVGGSKGTATATAGVSSGGLSGESRSCEAAVFGWGAESSSAQMAVHDAATCCEMLRLNGSGMRAPPSSLPNLLTSPGRGPQAGDAPRQWMIRNEAAWRRSDERYLVRLARG